MITLQKLQPKFFLILFLGLLPSFIFSQSITVILEKQNLEPTFAADDSNKTTYYIALLNDSDKPVNLAGQNYRLYYDSEAASFDASSIVSFLPQQYTHIKLVENYFDQDASGYGTLPFENHLGFINLAIDYNMSLGKNLSLKPGDWLNVGKIQFNLNGENNPDLVWAQNDLTHTYATAFVEMARVENNKLKKLNISDLIITDSRSTTSTSDSSLPQMAFYPNPFKDYLEISFSYPLSEDAQLELYDLLGKHLSTKTISAGADYIKLSGEEIPNGALLIKIHYKNGEISTFKAVKSE